MRCLFLYIFLTLGATSLSAQTNWLWAKSGGGKGNDQALSIAADSAGNVYAAGYYTDSAVFNDTVVHAAKGTKFFLAKYSPSGSLLWLKTSIAKGQSEAVSVCLSQNTYLYLTGYFSDSLVFTTDTLFSSGNAQNFFLAKFDLAGNEIWGKSAAASGGDNRKAVSSDEAGNAYVCGSFSGSAKFGATQLTSLGNSEDIFIAKFSPGGAITWAKQIGATADDAAFGIAASSSGNFVMTGLFASTVDFGGSQLTTSGTSDIFIAKYSADGNLLWARHSGDTSKGEGAGVALDKEENVYVTGTFSGIIPPDCDGSGNIYIAKYSAGGIKQWVKCMGAGSEETGNAIAADNAGNIFITGAYDEPIDFGTGQLSFDGIFDVFIVKLNSSGTAIWADKAGGGGDDVGLGVAIDSSGNILLAGKYTDTVYFGSTPLLNRGITDIFVTKIGAQSGVNNLYPPGRDFALYPNPAQNELNVSWSNEMSDEITVELFSVIGVSVKKVFSQISGKQIVSIPLEGIATGVYLCRISEGGISVGRILVRQ